MKEIKKYFPGLSIEQLYKLEKLGRLYKEWNQRINVVSRKDIDNIYLKHILHSLSITKVVEFLPGAEILDLGTGGGLPGLPLAIIYPEVNFFLVDGTGKKIMVVNEIIKELDLKNVKAKQIRAEYIKDRKFDFIITRAVATFDKLAFWGLPLLRNKQIHAYPNGIIALKGGNIVNEMEEIADIGYYEIYPLDDYYEEDFYEEKYLVYLQR